MRRASFCIVVLAAIALLATPAVAQRVTGQVVGVTRDESGALMPGVTATLSGVKVAGSRPVVTNEQGFYRFINLPPGLYDLVFTLDGFAPETQSGVRVSLGATTEIDVVMKIGGLAEAITVVAETPVVDTTSNEVGVNIGRDWVANAPIARSSFNDLVATAPGSLQGGEQSARTMVYGSSYDENSFQLDGADVNDNFFNESLAEANPDIIEEVEVLSLGAPAEYGNLTGAVYNVVTRQGSNEFHGDVNYYTQSDGLTGKNTTAEEDEGLPYTRDEFTDYSVQLGGPIAKDKLWFFASYNKQEDGSFALGADPALPLSRSFNDAERVFLKGNLQINPSHSLQFSYNSDEHSETAGTEAGFAPSTAFKRTTKTPTPSLGYTAVLSNSTLLDVRATGFRSEVFLGPADPNAPLQEPGFLDLDTYYRYGGWYYFYDLEPTRTTVNAKVSHLADEFLGASHDFRFGVQYNESSAGGLYGYNDLILTYSISYPGFGYGYSRAPFSYSGNTEALGVFVDDTVRVNDRLTLNFGVRYDQNRAFSEAQAELDADGNPTGVIFPEVEHFTWDYVSPRLGFNYQLTDDGRTVLKGHLGRYHRAIATGEFANIIGPSIKPIFAGFYDLTTDSFFEDTLFQITDNTNLLVDPNYDSPRTDQYILSLERQLKGNIGVALNLVYKRGRDFAAWEDIAGAYDTVTWIDGDYDLDGAVDPGVDSNATGNPITVFQLVSDPAGRVFQITNRPEMDTDIRVASLVVNKPMSNNWSLVSSLTFLRSDGRTPDSAQTLGVSGGGTSILQRGGLQFRQFGRDPNHFVNSGGRLRGDIPIQVKAQFVYQLPAGFLVSANLAHRDGANRVRVLLLPFDVAGQRSFILGEERGDFGRLPSQTIIDFRVEKTFALKNDVELAISADVFNALNDDAYDGVRSSLGTSSVFNQSSSFVLPRRVMLGGKVRF